jgi:putative ABC transport system substrate-binding protein
LRELSPNAKVIAMLVNPVSPDADLEITLVRAAAQSLELQLVIFEVRDTDGMPGAFAAIAGRRPDALLVGTDSFLQIRRQDVAARALALRMPAIYPFRNYVEAGGLMSYGTSIPNAYRQAGIYAGRILKGERPENRTCLI